MNKKWNVLQNTRLDIFLREQLPLCMKESDGAGEKGGNVQCEISNSKIRRLIMAGAVFVNGSQCRIPAFMMNKGTEVSAVIDEKKFFYEKKPDDIQFEVTDKSVLFEDDAIIVVNKPAFFPTEETIAGNRDNLHAAVIRYLWKKNPSLRNPPYVGIMHRLDRETSGVILFTKTRTVNAAVHDMFESHSAKKVYRAVCTKNSFLKEVPEHFSIDEPIGRVSSSSAACKMGVLPGKNVRAGGAKECLPARTDFLLVGRKNNLYYIEARPLTGRTHQIRVHLSWYGLPLVGDELYGGIPGGRIMLHAQSLTFTHPLTNETLCVSAPLPEEFLC